MCGIAGFFGSGDERVLRAMTEALSYRGPDGEGYFFDPVAKVGFGYRRLAIIDLASGDQPMFNEDKTIAVVFNGEIYNFQTLRKDLETRHRFSTHSDTEVIVHLYEEKGEECFKELEGMFAIALWDAPAKKMILARDRFGEKPLYWTLQNDTLIFSSEPKALFFHPSIRKELSMQSLYKYMLYEYVPSPHTIYRDIQKLEPAHYLVFKKGALRIAPYYQLEKVELHDGKNNEEILDQHLERAVEERLVSDVPLGVFLSGGIDSSTIAYFAQKHASRPINTFSIGFEEQTFDESGWAKKAAERIGTHHHADYFTKKQVLDTIPRIAEHLDEPLADASLLPTYFLSKFARNHVSVALGGDGGDELFFGYPTFVAHKLWPLYAAIPSSIKKIIKKGVGLLPVSHAYFSFDFKAKRFLETSASDDLIRNQLWLGAFYPEEYPRLFKTYARETFSFEDIDRHRAHSAAWDRLSHIDYLYLKHYMAEDILTKVDRASMYCSLEVRSPFLDTRLVEYVFSLPHYEKLRGLQTKHILKRLMAPRIGNDIVFRKKQGFGIPLAQWLACDLRDLLETYLNQRRLAKEGIFNPAYVRQLVDEHMARKADHRKRLWTLLVFEMWKERWGVTDTS